jgi:hypothetical protein
MIVKFDDHDYIDMSKVVAMRLSNKGDKGILVFEGERIVVGPSVYKMLESMYLWLHNGHIYGEGKKKVKTVVLREEGE